MHATRRLIAAAAVVPLLVLSAATGDCGHYVAEEQPARFTEILEDFLGGKPIAGVPQG